MKSFAQAASENPITTTMGILVLVNVATGAAISILDNDPKTTPDWGMVVQAAIGLAMVVAKDGWKFWEKKKDKE